MPIVNKEVKKIKSQYMSTCKSAYTSGCALNWVLTDRIVMSTTKKMKKGILQILVVIFYIIAFALVLSGIGKICGIPLAAVGYYLQREVGKM